MGVFTESSLKAISPPKVMYDAYIEQFIDTGFECANFDWRNELGPNSFYNYNFSTIVQGLRRAIKEGKYPVRIITKNYVIYFVKEEATK